MDVLHNFLKFEPMLEGKRAVEKYRGEHVVDSEMEEEILKVINQ